ncbi:transposase [Acetobacter fallax]|uniref:Transposase n=1 Tax=Acetobacter fallax TaxID=1737473 RepID=A0ABX0KB96_9PROT|nr:transposase [Acetobacter fallax]NHO36478.1 transposase [Acetobacter fallax]
MARASEAPKKGEAHQSVRLRRREEDQGRRRHIIVDTQDLLMSAIIYAADIQDRDGGVMLMSTMFGLFPFLVKLYADGGYQGPKFQQGMATVCRRINVEIVRRYRRRQVHRAPQVLDRREKHCVAQPLSKTGNA